MPSTPHIELKRHYRELPAEHTTEVVETVADLIVNFIKARSSDNAANRPQGRAETTQTNGTGMSIGSGGNGWGGSR